MRVAIVHDYLTQRGGAERVVLSMAKAFPGAPIYTSVFEPPTTFPEFSSLDVRTTWLNRVGAVRRRHRLGLPLYGPLFKRLHVDADVVLCSSSGWAHAATTDGRKVVYCHNTPRWLYQRDEYVGTRPGLARAALAVLGPMLARSDALAAASADVYLVNSSPVRQRVATIYNRDAQVLPPPPAVTPSVPGEVVRDIQPGYFLVVSRLLRYKNVAAVVDAFRHLPDHRLVVVGEGPEARSLEAAASANVRFLGRRRDSEIAWLYANAAALVAAGYEDFGLTPLEAASFGTPTVALRAGGYLDTMTEGTATFFDVPHATAIVDAVRLTSGRRWDSAAIRARASLFSEDRFISTLRGVVTGAEDASGVSPRG